MEILELNKQAKPTNKWVEYVPLCVLDHMEKIDMVGSYYTCYPKPDTDIDILCLVKLHKGLIGDVLCPLLKEGWHFQEDYGLDGGTFTSMKKKGSKVNLIITNQTEFYTKFIIARNVCKELNIMDKKVRCKIHDLIMKHKEKE